MAPIPPDIAAAEMRAAGVEPLVPYPGSHHKWRCRCLGCDREIAPRLHDVRGGHRACGWCAGQLVDPGVRAEAMRAAGLEPLEPYRTAWTKWRCRCTRCGAEVAPTYAGISQGEGGCWTCRSQKIAEKLRIAEPDAVALMRAAGAEPLAPYRNSRTPWLCECGHCGRQITPQLNSIKRGQAACRYCAGKAVDAESAHQLMVEAGFEPLAPYARVAAPWLCRCQRCGNEVSPTYQAVKAGGGCRYCAGLVVDPEQADALAADRGMTPLELYPGANKKWRCRCDACGSETTTTYTQLRVGTGCKPCAMAAWSRAVLAQGAEQAVQDMRAAGVTPTVEYPGSSVPWACTCDLCGREISPRLSSVRAGQGACRYCATKGIDLNGPALIYLITHAELHAHKLGISSPSGVRLKQHTSRGWEVYKTLQVTAGERALEIEAALLTWLRLERSIPVYLSKAEMPQRGHTETMAADAISLPSLWRRLQRLAAEQWPR